MFIGAALPNVLEGFESPVTPGREITRTRCINRWKYATNSPTYLVVDEHKAIRLHEEAIIIELTILQVLPRMSE